MTSLTKKNYDEAKGSQKVEEETVDKDGGVQYSLILDSGDAHLLGGKRNVHDVTGDPVTMQSDLEPVEDERLGCASVTFLIFFVCVLNLVRLYLFTA